MRYRRVSFRYEGAMPEPGLSLVEDPWFCALHAGVSQEWWQPPADFMETDQGFVARLEVAGLAEEDFTLSIYEDVLVVEGERALHPSAGRARYLLAGLRYGPFRLQLPIPSSADRDRVRATYDRGFLTVLLPRRRETS